MVDVQVGSRVVVGTDQSAGVIAFVGKTEFSPGEWIGVVLDEPVGKNAGRVKDKFYFECKPNHGIFVRRGNLALEGSDLLSRGSTTEGLARAPIRKLSQKEASKPAVPDSPPQAFKPAAPDLPLQVVDPEKLESRRSVTFKQVNLEEEDVSATTTPTPDPLIALDAMANGPSGPASIESPQSPPHSPGPAKKTRRTVTARTSDGGSSPKRSSTEGDAPLVVSSSSSSLPLAEVARVKADLAEAIEEHDVEWIRLLLPQAVRAGLPQREIDLASRIMHEGVQAFLVKEVSDMRALVSQLSECVSLAQARAEAAEAASNRAAAQAARPVAKAAPELRFPADRGGVSDAWIEKVGRELEERVWSSLRKRVEESVKSALSLATRSLVQACDELKRAKTASGQGKKTKLQDDGDGQEDSDGETKAKPVERRLQSDKLRTLALARCITDYWLTSASAIYNQRSDIIDERRQKVRDLQRKLALSSPKEQLERAREDAAAIKLQAYAKGRMTRKETSRRMEVEATKKRVEGRKTNRAVLCIQRYYRGHLGKGMRATGLTGFALLSDTVLQRAHEWEAVMRRHMRRGEDGLSCANFSLALRQVHPRISSSQALALWNGYLKGGFFSTIDWQGFYSICEAVAIDDYCAAEFADLPVDMFRLLARGQTSEEAAALKMQTTLRNHLMRKRNEEDEFVCVAAADIDDTEEQDGEVYTIVTDVKHARRIQMEREWGKQGPPDSENYALLCDLESANHRAAKREQAAIAIQKHVRAAMCRMAISNRSLGSVAVIVQKRYKKWRGVFEKAIGKRSYLDRESFTNCLCNLYPRLSTAQVKAVWEGFREGTGLETMDLRGFSSICTAADTDDFALSEFADMCLEDFKAIGHTPRERELTAAAIMVQKNFRRMRVWNRLGRRSFYSVALALRRRYKAFAEVFDMFRKEDDNLNVFTFGAAVQAVSPRLSERQVDALWCGICEGTGRNFVDLRTFCEINELALDGDKQLASYADISLEAFQELGDRPRPTSRTAQSWQRSRPDLYEMFMETLPDDKSQELTAPLFYQAIIRAHPHISRGQADAMWAGYQKQKKKNSQDRDAKKQTMGLVDFCLAAEALEYGDDDAADWAGINAEYFRMLPVRERESAAAKIQANLRGNLARQKCGGSTAASRKQQEKRAIATRTKALVADPRFLPATLKLQTFARTWISRRRFMQKKFGSGAAVFQQSAMMLVGRNARWARIYMEALDEQEFNEPALSQKGFLAAILKACHGRLNQRQAAEHWRSIVDGLDSELCDMKTFCALCKAVSISDSHAAEFADMMEGAYVALGAQPDGDALVRNSLGACRI